MVMGAEWAHFRSIGLRDSVASGKLKLKSLRNSDFLPGAAYSLQRVCDSPANQSRVSESSRVFEEIKRRGATESICSALIRPPYQRCLSAESEELQCCKAAGLNLSPTQQFVAKISPVGFWHLRPSKEEISELAGVNVVRTGSWAVAKSSTCPTAGWVISASVCRVWGIWALALPTGSSVRLTNWKKAAQPCISGCFHAPMREISCSRAKLI